MKKSESPALNLSSLLSILDRNGTAEEPSPAPTRRLQALQAWTKSLERRDELNRRWEQLQHEGNGGPLASRSPTLSPQTTTDVHVLEPANPKTLTETFLAAANGTGELVDARGLDHTKLTDARKVAQVGSVLPEFPYYGRAKRFFARQVARGVLYLAGVLTSHQRIYNTNLLDLVSESGANTDHQAARLDHLAHAVHRLAAGIDEGFTAKQTEIRHLSSALRHLEGQLRQDSAQASTQALEQERQMAEAACEQAWLRLAEVELREEARGLDQRLEQLEASGNGVLTSEARAEAVESATVSSATVDSAPSEDFGPQLAAVRQQQDAQAGSLGDLANRLGRIEAIAGDLKPVQEIHQDHDLALKGFNQRLGWLEELPKELKSQHQARVTLDRRLGGTEQRLGRLEEYLQENLKALHTAQRRQGALLEQLDQRLDRLASATPAREGRSPDGRDER